MTKEDKELLLKDLCTRLPYKVKCYAKWKKTAPNGTTGYIDELSTFLLEQFEWMDEYEDIPINDVKPYLRPMSSMTEEERAEFYKVGGIMSHKVETDTYVLTAFSPEAYDWLNAHHFDYRGLIEKGLALTAPDGMYEKKKE